MILLYTQRKQLTTLGQLLYFYAWDAVPGRLLLSRHVSSDASCFPAMVTWSYSVSLLAYIRVELDTRRAIRCAEGVMGRCRARGLLVVVLFRRWAMSTVRRNARGAPVRKITRVCCIPSTFLRGWISTFETSSSLLPIPFRVREFHIHVLVTAPPKDISLFSDASRRRHASRTFSSFSPRKQTQTPLACSSQSPRPP